MTCRSVYLVDDNPAFRASAHWWLAGAGYAVHDFGDPARALAALCQAPPQDQACLLLDVHLPGLSGPELQRRLRAQGMSIPIIFMTGQAEVAQAVLALQGGAVSYLEKPFVEQALEEALDRAFAIRRQAVPRGEEAAGKGVSPGPSPGAHDPAHDAWQKRLATLTPREREVHRWILDDRLNKSIASSLGISVKTVELHRAHLMRKLGARSLIHLVKMTVSGRVW